MGYAEKRGDYYRGRYKLSSGKYGTVTDASGATIRFRTKREAEEAANDAEAQVRGRRHRDPTAGRTTFGAYVNIWYAAQDLAASTMDDYRRSIENHLLPTFEVRAMADISRPDIALWEKSERALGYAESSIRLWRATLHLILADAVDEGIIVSNPASRRRGKGKRTGRSRKRSEEKTITTALGVLLLAERASLLSGRDDEFVAVVLDGFSGMRWGELVGLEPGYVQAVAIRVEWQLYELDSGEFHRCPPKAGSHRTIHIPGWLGALVADHIGRTQYQPCLCHGLRYTFSGNKTANGAVRSPGPKLIDVARRARVSAGTVSNVVNRPDAVAESTRTTVRAAMEELGYIRGATPGVPAPHWRRNGFATWIFQPAATGWYPAKAPSPTRPVPISAEPWPGLPIRGRNAAARAEACWLPVAPGLTPHGLRHTYKTLMEELGTPAPLMDEQMGHSDGSVQARYSHATPQMVSKLLAGLTELWEAALEVRRQMSAGSPVTVLDRLLREREG